jgi:two-component system phosphate regulon sensor histidine kinase PhoR
MAVNSKSSPRWPMTSWPAAASSAAPLPEPADPGPGASGARDSDRTPPRSRRHDTVNRQITRLVASVLTLLVLTGAAAIIALSISSASVNRIATGYGPAADFNDNALIALLDAETGIRGYGLSGKSSFLQPYRAAVRRIMPDLQIVSHSLDQIGDHSLDQQITRETRLAHEWITKVGQRASVSAAAARRIAESSSAKNRFDDLNRANARLSDELDHKRDHLRDVISTERRWLMPILIGVVVAALAIATVVAVRIARSVSRPLTAASRTARRLEAGDLSARADDRAGPVEVREVSAAINSLGIERRRALAIERADEQLRREVRSLTAAIRIGQDPRTIARTLVAGLGRVFDVDRVWMRTFDEERVAVITEQWRRGNRMPIVEPSVAEVTELRWLASRLWHGGSVAAVADHGRAPADADPYLLRAPLTDGARSSAVVSVGEGGKALGLLWLSTAAEAREWTSTELGLMQHVAAELAQNLVQNHVLSQQREAMRRLREADEAKTALVSTVSHELRTPLTSIIGYLDVLLDFDTDSIPDDVAAMLRVIDRNAQRLRALIEDLLTQSQIEAGRRLVELSRIDLVDVLGEVQDTIEPLADNAHLAYSVHVPERGRLVVDGDARQLGQAITNLAANAVKFTQRGGRVELTAWREDAHGHGEAVVSVRDTGIGIPKAELPRLFDRFFRATNARKAVIQGTGLGLAIVAEIVKAHHGTVQVESELGQGTTFVIRLPIATDTTAETRARTDDDATGFGTVEIG